MSQFSGRFVKNVSMNTVSYVLQIVTVFFMSPFIVSSLGKDIYGVWSLLASLSGYMGLVDMGVRVTTGRYLNFYLGKKDFDKAGQSVATSYAIYTVLSAVLLLASIVLIFIFPHLFPKTPAQVLPEVKIALPLLAISIWISFYNATTTQLLVAANRYDLCSFSSIFSSLAKAGLAVVSLKMGFGIVGLAVTQAIVQLLQWIQVLYWSKKYGVQVPISISGIRKDTVVEIFSFGGWSFVRMSSLNLISYSGAVLVGLFLGTTAVTYYSLGLMLIDYATNLTRQVVSVTVPEFTKRAGAGDQASLLRLLMSSTRITAWFALPTFFGVMYLSPAFIKNWMGLGFEDAYLVAIVIAPAALLATCSGPSFFTLWGMGIVKTLAISEGVKLCCNLLLCYVFVKVLGWGLWGMALGVAIPMAIDSLIWVPYLICKTLHYSLIKYYRQTVGLWGSYALVCIAILEVVRRNHLLDAKNWVAFFTTCVVFTILFSLPAIPWILGRELTIQIWKKIFNQGNL